MDELQVSRHDGVLSLTLDRPAKRNALSASLVESLHATVRAARTDGTRLLVLRGNGANLSAGFDLGGDESRSDGDLLHRFVQIELLLQAIHHAPYDTLALAHGRNFGAGADLLVACEHRVASTDATFRFPGLAFGVVLGTRRLATRTGATWAHRTLAGMQTVTAGPGHDAGMLTAVANQDRWDEIVDETARTTRLLDQEGRAGMRRALVRDTRDADLADLVRSAGRPGLSERIRTFRKGGAG
jgi:enoyl-CoA hydratase